MATATASASSEQTLREINTRLREIHREIGKSSGVFNLLGQVREINRKTRRPQRRTLRMNDFYKDYAARKQKDGVPSSPNISQRWNAMTAAKRAVAICLLLGLLVVGGCGVAAMTGALDSPPTARECQEERDRNEIDGWPQAMVQGAFENCRREWRESEGIEP